MSAKQIGVMVPLFSLRGAHGIGDVDSMYALVNRFARSGISVIQLLPMNAVAGDDSSPYSSISSFAMNPLYISLSRLPWLESQAPVLEKYERVDYSRVSALKYKWLQSAWDSFLQKSTQEEQKRFSAYCSQREWLDSYAVFHALSMEYKSAWWDWPQELQNLDGGLVWAEENEKKVGFFRFLQWVFFEQWQALIQFASEFSIRFMGDLPLYVSKNSADFWSCPEVFKKGVHAGVPPDMYAKEGQDWGNPIYDWEKMAKDGFTWWKGRLLALKDFCSLARIDHIRGIYSYWEVPDGKKPIDVKDWTPGPGKALIEALKTTQVELIGEDLGDIPPEVDEWMAEIKVPGYRVFLFGWGPYRGDKYAFCDTYPQQSLACTSTHDSESFWEFLSAFTPEMAFELGTWLGIEPEEKFTLEDLRQKSIQKLISCPSAYVMIPLQDIIARPIRINLPGSVGDTNWTALIPLGTEEQKYIDQFALWIEQAGFQKE